MCLRNHVKDIRDVAWLRQLPRAKITSDYTTPQLLPLVVYTVNLALARVLPA